MHEVKHIRSRGGHEVEVVTRRAKRQSALGDPKPRVGERVQKNMDKEVMEDLFRYASLDTLTQGSSQ